jgi:DNA primase
MPPVVVESVPTAAFIMSQGYPAVATFGASLNEPQIKLLRGFQQGVRFAPDKGKAGEEAYWKAAGQLQKYIPVAWINPPDELAEKEDLGDLSSNPNLVCNLIEEAPWLLRSINR